MSTIRLTEVPLESNPTSLNAIIEDNGTLKRYNLNNFQTSSIPDQFVFSKSGISADSYNWELRRNGTLIFNGAGTSTAWNAGSDFYSILNILKNADIKSQIQYVSSSIYATSNILFFIETNTTIEFPGLNFTITNKSNGAQEPV